MGNASILEAVNIVDNAFTADSRNKEGKRVVTFDAPRALQLHLFAAHILQIEAVSDSVGAVERGVITMSSGIRYISARGAATICADIGKLAS
jgi:hypothetical protein